MTEKKYLKRTIQRMVTSTIDLLVGIVFFIHAHRRTHVKHFNRMGVTTLKEETKKKIYFRKSLFWISFFHFFFFVHLSFLNSTLSNIKQML